MANAAAASNSKRRWYHWLVPRFSLRTLLIAVTVFAVAFGFWVERAERQRRVAEFLAKKNVSWYFEGDVGSTPPPRTVATDHYWRSITTMRVHSAGTSREEAEEILSQITGLPSLKALQFHCYFPNFDWSPLSHASNLTDVDMQGTNMRSEDFATIARLPRLKNLKLFCFGYRVGDLSPLGNARGLEHLQLQFYEGSDLDLSFVTKLPRLKRLRVNDADDRLCESLSGSKTLKQLWSTYGRITNTGVEALSNISTLEDLDLMGTFVTDDAIDSLSRLPKLKTINLTGTRVTYNGIVRLCQKDNVEKVLQGNNLAFDTELPGLRHPVTPLILDNRNGVPADLFRGRPVAGSTWTAFEFSGEELPKDFYRALGDLSGVTSLELTDCNVSNADLAEFKRLKVLTKLNLTGTNITVEGLSHLKGMTSLQQLNIPAMDDWDSVGEYLRDLPSLTLSCDFGSLKGDDLAAALGQPIDRKTFALDLSCVPYGPTVKANLAAARHLRSLSLADTPSSDDDLDFLANYGAIEDLSLARTKVTDHIAPQLAALRTLTSLDLSGTSITDETLAQLAHLPNLKKLIVNDTSITDTGVEKLIAARTLEEVGIRGTNVTDKSLTYLKELPRLQTLNVGRSYSKWLAPGDVPRGAISETAFALLKDYPSLQQLDLVTEDLTPGNVATLRQMPSITQLTTEDLDVIESSFKTLMQRSAPPRTLKGIGKRGRRAITLPFWMPEEKESFDRAIADLGHVRLQGTDKTDQRLKELAGTTNPTLVSLSNTDVTMEGISKLEGMQRLRRLHLDEPQLGKEVVPQLCKMRSLEIISWQSMKLGSDEFEQFKGLPFLRELWCQLPDLSADEQRALRKKYPFLRRQGPRRSRQ